MFTAKTLADGQLQTTQYIPQPYLDEESGEISLVYPSVPDGEVLVDMPSDEISLHFRSSWKLVGEVIVVDLASAKAQRKAFIVDLIDQRLQEIDNKATRALRDAVITGNKTYVQQYETQAAALRSVRSNTGVDSLTSVAEVAAYLPEVLA